MRIVFLSFFISALLLLTWMNGPVANSFAFAPEALVMLSMLCLLLICEGIWLMVQPRESKQQGNPALESKIQELQLQLSEAQGRAESLLSESKRSAGELTSARGEIEELKTSQKTSEAKIQALQSAAREMGNEELYGTIINFIGRLQEKGRLLDFVSSDVSTRSDEEVGRVARIVWQGAKEVIAECFAVAPLAPEPEKSDVTLDENFERASYSISGNTTGSAPYSGKLLHRGWAAERINLPKVLKPAKSGERFVISAAEVRIK